jgi:hypothetical protein
MPGRPRRTPKAPKVKVELVYEESSTIREVAERVIRLYAGKFGWTANFKLGYLLVHGSKPKEGGRDVAARFRKVPPLYHGITGLDAVVEVHAWAWNGYAGSPGMSAEEQEAIVVHELCHGSMSERGALRVEKHDLEEFHFVVGQYGAWTADVQRFEEQLSLFAARGPIIATGAGRSRQESAGLADDEDLRPKGEVNAEALRGEADRATVAEPTPIKRPRNGHQPPASPLS